MSSVRQGFWLATPSASPSCDPTKAYYIRMRIALSEGSYDRKSEPYYVRFRTRAGQMVHLPIDQYRYVEEGTLEIRFFYGEPDAFPLQTPTVCFDKDDVGSLDEEEESFDRPLELYAQLCTSAAVVRDKLEARFPDCRQTDVGFMGNDLLLFLRLRGNFAVAVASDRSAPMFVWDRRFLVPCCDQAEPTTRLGGGFRVTLPAPNGGANHFWYECDRAPLFASVKQVVRYAEEHVYKGEERRIDPERHRLSTDLIQTSATLATQLRRLARAVPYVKIATFSRVEHAIRVYVDLQWRCEVSWVVCLRIYSSVFTHPSYAPR